MKDYFGTSKTEFKKAVKKAVHQSNIEQAKQMKDWKQEANQIINEWSHRVNQLEDGHSFIKHAVYQCQPIIDFISSLLLSQRKEVINEIEEKLSEVYKLTKGKFRIYAEKEGDGKISILTKEDESEFEFVDSTPETIKAIGEPIIKASEL